VKNPKENLLIDKNGESLSNKNHQGIRQKKVRQEKIPKGRKNSWTGNR